MTEIAFWRWFWMTAAGLVILAVTFWIIVSFVLPWYADRTRECHAYGVKISCESPGPRGPSLSGG